MKNNNKPLISVIVPCYNVEKYVSQCLDSILRQSYSNLEIILVDDGSSDDTGFICENYSLKDKRVSVIHKKNGGQSDARNVGINSANGEYITFIDSDDMIADIYIEFLYKLCINYKSEIAGCSFLEFRDLIIENIAKKTTSYKNEVLDSIKAVEIFLYQTHKFNAVCGWLYHKKLFDNLCFKKGIIYEDLDIFYKLFLKTNIVVFSTKILYYYRKSEHSTLCSKFNMSRLAVLDVCRNIIEYMHKTKPEIVPAAESRYISALFNIMTLTNDDVKFRHIQEVCWNEIVRLRRKVLKDNHIRIKNRLILILSYCGFNFIIKLLAFNRTRGV